MSNTKILEKQFEGRSVVITGHTGFKGSWLAAWMKNLGACVTGIALDPITNLSHYEVINLSEKITDLRIDIRNKSEIKSAILEAKPDYLFHLAAQPLVRKSYINPSETWETNVLGTINILEALRSYNKTCASVIITSDKCYDNVEWEWGYRETDALGGPDPYSASKGAAELAIRSYIKSYFPYDISKVRIASARAGNVIGGGDWAEDRIIPDCVSAWSKDNKVNLRNPKSTRPWQHVLEPLGGYITLAVNLLKNPSLHGEPFNFGPSGNTNHSVLKLVEQMAKNWNKVRWDDISDSNDDFYESGLLKLNCDKALHFLKWRAVMEFEDTVNMTSEWYRSFYKNKSGIDALTSKQIDEYSLLAKKRGLDWAQ